MMDEIFEMVMKEARSRPGDNLKEKAFSVINDLTDKVGSAFNCGLEKALERYSKEGKIP